MNTYLIHEDNLERLEKKITTIKNKCLNSNLSFSYKVLNTVFHEVTADDGRKHTAKFYEIELEGSIKHEGWRFAATIEHKDAGNIIRNYDSKLEIPARFRTCKPNCEHCNRIRSRKDTYVIYNEETKEFKQVGKQCMKEYTNGLDAEDVAHYISLFNEAINGEEPYTSSYKTYLDVEETVRFAAECIRHFGYEKIYEDDYRTNKNTTRGRVTDYMNVRHGKTAFYHPLQLQKIKEEMDSVNFDENSEYAVNLAKEALEWIKTAEGDNGYISNLKVATSEQFAETRDFGLIVSLPVAYNRHLGYIKKQNEKAAEIAARKAIEQASQYVGEIKDKLTVEASNFTCITTLYSQYGETYVYKWNDENNNIFVWYASNPVEEPEKVVRVKGTVKDHSEYRGAKQTILTRCKVETAE